MKPRPILLVDDSPLDRELALDALARHYLANEIISLCDGVEALDYLYCREQFIGRETGHPSAIILDLKMPRIDGLEVLRQIKSDPDLRLIPVVIMTSSKEQEDLICSYRLGVNAYVQKPLEFPTFFAAMKQLGSFWGVLNEVP